ncbi:hypothetical protein [Microbulbifer sp. ZKSA002]|uniref:hypothetical protein n=1 Tax=Microbulbifer sp. ZKSA002 TaxID=3243388 RepID=UPI00403A29B2
MAINPNTALPARHMFLCGGTGSGKSSFLRRLGHFSEFQRVLLWDPDRDHQAQHFSSPGQFKNAVMQSIAKRSRDRIAFVPDQINEESFEFFCAVFWAALDGNYLTGGIVEELADVTGSGKARGTWGQLSRKSRKYGGVIHSVSQRPAEIDKSILSMSPYKFCGTLETDAERKYLSGLLSVSPDQLAQTPANEPGKVCNYWLKKPGPEPAQLGKFNPVSGTVSL